MKSGIYQIRNTENGKLYIGSAKKLNIRWTDHKKLLKKNAHPNPHLQHAWNKCGSACFVFEVLERVPEYGLINREQYYMDLFESHSAKFGYNICKFAANTLGKKHSASALAKIDAANKARAAALTAEDRLTMSVNNPRNRIIRQYDLDGKFLSCHRSAREAARAIGKGKAAAFSIGQAARRNVGNFSQEYYWFFEDDDPILAGKSRQPKSAHARRWPAWTA